jgi:hypothetical protein
VTHLEDTGYQYCRVIPVGDLQRPNMQFQRLQQATSASMFTSPLSLGQLLHVGPRSTRPTTAAVYSIKLGIGVSPRSFEVS